MRHFLALLAWTVSSLACAGPLDELAAGDWTQAQSKHFKIVTDQPEATARLMLTDLETLRHVSSRGRGVEIVETAPPLTILAIGKPGNFKKLGLTRSVAGQFSLGRTGFAALAEVENYRADAKQSSPARTTLLHEYHHALMRLGVETLALPRWYDEGMAEYWSSMTIENGRAVFGRPVEGQYREHYLVSKNGAFDIDTLTLFNQRELDWDKDDDRVDRFYAQSLYVIHYFNSSQERLDRLKRYIALYNQGISQDRAAQLAFAMTYAQLDEEIVRYLRRGLKGRIFKLGKDGLALPDIEMRVTRLTPNATWAVFAEVLPRHVAPDPALLRTMLDTNLKLNPDDPEAWRLHHAYLGETSATIAELVKRFPQHAPLHAMHGEAMRTYADAMRATALEGWQARLLQARAAHLRANRLDASQPLPFRGLGEIQHALPGKEALEAGIMSMDMAAMYERSPDAFRKLARMYLRAGHIEGALAAMRSAVAFGAPRAEELDIALQENLEVMAGPLAPGASVTPTGLAWPDGSSYVGPVQDGKPAGVGKYTRASGSWYEGGFAGGLPHGRGKLVSERGIVFEGSFDTGVARGRGRLYATQPASTMSYEGEVDYMLPSGGGVMVLPSGRYQGQFLEGMQHGAGTFTALHGAAQLNGTWRYGLHDFPPLDGVLFTGPVGAHGEREGQGWCRPAGQPSALSPCFARDGKLNNGSTE